MIDQSIPKSDAFGWHEALDRSCVCMEMVDTYLLFHPTIESNEALKAKVETAHRLLFEVYQEIGGRMADEGGE